MVHPVMYRAALAIQCSAANDSWWCAMMFAMSALGNKVETGELQSDPLAVKLGICSLLRCSLAWELVWGGTGIARYCTGTIHECTGIAIHDNGTSALTKIHHPWEGLSTAMLSQFSPPLGRVVYCHVMLISDIR